MLNVATVYCFPVVTKKELTGNSFVRPPFRPRWTVTCLHVNTLSAQSLTTTKP